MRRRYPIFLTAAAVLAIPSCGTDPEVMLTSTEAQAVLRAILEEFDGFEFEAVECDHGGETTASRGEERRETKGDTVIFTREVRLSFAQCQVSVGGAGRYTLSGDPALTHSQRTAYWGDFQGHAHWTLSGTFGWERGEESGRCGVDFTLDTGFDDVWPEVEDPYYRGRVCGHEAELSLSDF
ncbi:MAG: hypothetical protein OXQ94_13115 [Gemmatimonadota bacterium]|nr:hypothetical protein [Gemmatimonadota bacterium]MDE2872613.1 hypothetical protein [Gemmatimonadota bacterium]